MTYHDFKVVADEIRKARPEVVDCAQLDLYSALKGMIPPAPADITNRVHRCHLASKWLEIFDLPSAWSARALVSSGIRDSLSKLFTSFASESKSIWIPKDVYPVYHQLALAAGINMLGYDTITGPNWPNPSSSNQPEILLVANPLIPAGRWLSESDVESLKCWLTGSSDRRIIIDSVYNFSHRFHPGTLELYSTDQVILLHSLTKGWLHPKLFGIALVPPSDVDFLKEIFRDNPPPQINLFTAENLLANFEDSPERIRRELSKAKDTMSFRIDSDISSELIAAKSEGYLISINRSWEGLLEQSNVLAIPVSVFGSRNQDHAILSALNFA